MGGRLRPNTKTVGVPWPGMYAPLASITCSRSTAAQKPFDKAPKLALMKLLRSDLPDEAGRIATVVADRASSKKRSMNGTVSANCR